MLMGLYGGGVTEWATENVNGFVKAEIVPPYGQLVRGVPGKAGWFSGIYSVIFANRFLGLTYDASSEHVRFVPLLTVGDYSWSDFPIGDQRFTVAYQSLNEKVFATFKNQNSALKHLEITLPVIHPKKCTVKANNKLVSNVLKQYYLGNQVVKFNINVAANSSVEIEVNK